jgi:hypothetical protein
LAQADFVRVVLTLLAQNHELVRVQLLYVVRVLGSVEPNDVVGTVYSFDDAALACPRGGCHSYDVFNVRSAASLLLT